MRPKRPKVSANADPGDGVIILALDIATRTGFAVGPAGERPYVGATRMKGPKDDLTIASNNVGYLAYDLIMEHGVDLVVAEEPLDPHVKAAMGQRANTRAQNPASIKLPWLCRGALSFVCSKTGRRLEGCSRQTVLRQFTGRSSYPGADADERRKAAKREVIKRAQLLKLIPPQCNDDDIADAVAIHWWASAFYGRVQPKVLHLFGERA
jgi:hypothetical protein